MATQQRSIKLAYRDVDRTPVIYCIQEMARRHYDLEVDVVRIQPTEEYEASLFDGSGDILIEHLEYLYEKAAEGVEVTFFCAPVIETGMELVVRPGTRSIDELRGGRIAVRLPGRPHAATMRLRHMGLLDDVEVVHISDRDIGRWQQWRRVADGDCGAAWISSLYLPPALDAGLEVLPVPDIEVVSHYAQACLASFPREHPDLFETYVKAMLHAMSLVANDPDAAFEIAMGEPMRLIGIEDRAIARRAFDAITGGVRARPYPTTEALKNGYEIAVEEYPAAAAVDPSRLWDLSWVQRNDDSGFIGGLYPA